MNFVHDHFILKQFEIPVLMFELLNVFLFSTIQSQLKPTLEQLKNDEDGDVQYFAIEAIEGKHSNSYS